MADTAHCIPYHISLTPNGNRRKARKEKMSYEESYTLGALHALEVAGWAKDVGVKHVTFFGLSCENMLRRPQEELDALQEGAIQFCDAAMESGIRLHPFGKIDVFENDPKYARLYERLQKLRAQEFREDEFVVHVATNYSGEARHELEQFMHELRYRGFSEVEKDPARYLLSGGVPAVDLAIRTGGEHRISGLLPFQMAYAELYFTPLLWLEFDKAAFDASLRWFAEQPRNFGK